MSDAHPSEALAEGIGWFVEQLTQDYATRPVSNPDDTGERRRIASIVRARWAAGGPAMRRTVNTRVTVGQRNVPIRVHIPQTLHNNGTLIYAHGGGWVLFDLDTHDRLMREYAARAGVVVVGVDYARAPEHPFPAAIEDIAGIVRALPQLTSMMLPQAPGKLVLGGDSAGANLSVAAALRLRDDGLISLVDGLLLNYGAFDSACRSASYDYYGDGRYLLSADEMHGFWRSYVPNPANDTHPLVNPLRADLAHLPPSWLCVAEHDVLQDDSHRMHAALQGAGCSSSLRVYPGTVHSFLEAMSVAPVAAEALDDAAQWLGDMLHA